MSDKVVRNAIANVHAEAEKVADEIVAIKNSDLPANTKERLINNKESELVRLAERVNSMVLPNVKTKIRSN